MSNSLQDVAEYLAHQDIDATGLDAVPPLPSFLDPAAQLPARPVGWSPLARQSDAPLDLRATQAEAMGLASMAAVHYMRLQPGQTVLDACAAPGMKSLYIKSLQPAVALTANDLSYGRLQRLQRLLASHGADVTSSQADARQLHTSLAVESFDRVLVDAPCSGEGLIMAGDAKHLAAWSPAKVKRLQQLQVRIVKSAWQLLKPGGRLVYSTCTLNRNENERVLHKALAATQSRGRQYDDYDSGKDSATSTGHAIGAVGFGDVSVITRPLQLDSLPALQSGQAWRIMPGRNSIGFFIAVIDKPANI